MANTPIEPIVVNDPKFGTLTWTPGEHAQGHLAGLSSDERAVIMEQVAAMVPNHARQLTETACVVSDILNFMRDAGASLEDIRDVVSVPIPVIEVDLEAGPSFWPIPAQPERLEWRSILNW